MNTLGKLGKSGLQKSLSSNKSASVSSQQLVQYQKKFLNKTFRPTMYNLRLYYSNLHRNEDSYGKWDMVYGPDGMEKTQTDRNPNNFKYTGNLFHHTKYELRHIYGDAFYQMIQRRHRLKDPFMKYVMPTAIITSYLLSGQHFFFLVR